MDDRVCPKCGRSAYRFPKCPWCGSLYSQDDQRDLSDLDGVTEKKTSKAWVVVWFLLITLIFGPHALGLLGVALKSLNDSLGFAPVSQGGVITALHWAPILAYVTWPSAVLLFVIAVVAAILNGMPRRGDKK